MVVNRMLLILCGILIQFQLIAQDPDTHISIDFSQEPLLEALAKLDRSTSKQLSFNPQILPQDQFVDGTFMNEPVEEVLGDLIGPSFEVKSISNYLIIQKRVMSKQKTTYKITGGVTDAITGLKLQDVSIYEINSLESTLTDGDGSFELKAKTGSDVATFLISKENYKDTVIQISNMRQLETPIILSKEKENKLGKAIRDKVKVYSNGLAKFFTSDKVIKNARNVNMVDTRLAQISLVPALGTNRKMSSQIKNKISLNLISGYSYGVRGFELGGFYNIAREEVRGAQIGGFGNTVGGEVHGLQMGGFTNLTKEMQGVQIAGFNNHTKDVSGFQLSGFINTTGEMDGFQLTGFINWAQEVRGLQLSVVNVADSVVSGTQFGLLNIVRKNGLLSPGIESDEVVPYRFAFRSGMEKFYTVLSIGTDPGDHWTLGVGFGSRLFPRKQQRFFLNPELRWLNLAKGAPAENENNYMVRFNFNLGYTFFKRLSITTGPSVNFYVTNQLDETGMPELNIANAPFLDDLSGNTRYQMWLGYTVGVNF